MAGSGSLHVVFGGSGGLGNAVVRELVARGMRVRAVDRSGRAKVPEGVEVVAGDATDHEAARRVCRGATVVYNCANASFADWPTRLPPIMDGIIEGASSAGAKLVFGDNLDMYGPVSGPITEDLPYSATGRNGRTRARIARTLMEAHRTGKVRAAIGRASDFYGPSVLNSAIGERVFRPALAGGAASKLGRLDVPHTYTYVGDFAKALVTLGEREEALGEVWHVPSAETLTTRRFLEMVFEEAGTRPRYRPAPRFLVRLLSPFMPATQGIKEMYYEFDEPFIMDHGKYERTFGGDTTPHREAVRETLDWFRRNPL